MSGVDRDDMVVIGMSIDALLECVRQTEACWRWSGGGDCAPVKPARSRECKSLTVKV
jgi:hypothetical protein